MRYKRKTMIVVNIDVWPGGDQKRARQIARMEISNTSELSDVSDYLVCSQEIGSNVTGLPDRSLACRVLSHYRRQSVFALVAKAANAIVGQSTRSK